MKNSFYAAPEKLGVHLRQTLKLLAQQGKRSFKQVLLTEENTCLMATIVARLTDPKPSNRTSLNDL